MNAAAQRSRGVLGALLVALTGCLPATPPPVAPTPDISPPALSSPPSACGTAVTGLGLATTSVQSTEVTGPVSMPPVDPETPIAVTTVDADGRPAVRTVEEPDTAELEEIVDEARAEGQQVVAIEVDPVVHVDAADPGYGNQWAMSHVPFEAVWPTSTGTGACVAVLDTGIDLGHPDVAAQVAASYDLTGEGPSDGHGHGTHVAGIIAAVANNGVGIAGAAPGATLLNVKVLDSAGSGYTSQTAAGVIWAVDHGAAVVNMSLGSVCPEASPGTCLSTAMQTALAYAEANDVVVVASGGNNGDPDDPPGNPTYNYWSWPAAYPWPIAVAATTSGSTRASFSTQASYLDVAAPGGVIYSTVTGGAYGYMSGTSMAAPHVAALAALLRGARPAEPAAQIRARIVDHTVDLGPAGHDPSFGNGLIDPTAALHAP